MTPRRAARFRSRYGPWALVAGASNGLGSEFAHQLAEVGLNLVLVGRRRAPLEELADQLEVLSEIETSVVSADLSVRAEVEELLAATADLEIGLVVSNAALAPIGEFIEEPGSLHDQLLELNCRTPLRLTHEFARRMGSRGGIILLSSMAAFQGTLLSAHYAATKAYLRILAEGLWAELHPRGIDVIAACPGTVNTPTFQSDNPVNRRFASLPVLECRPVVAQTLRALGRKPVVVPGVVNRVAAFLMERLLPRRMLIAATARTTRGMYPHRATGVRESR